MAKEKTVYVCSNCGQESPKWVGKCPSCGEWNTYVEEIVRKEVPNKRPVSGIESPKAKPVTLSEIEADEEPRIDMHDEELNRVLNDLGLDVQIVPLEKQVMVLFGWYGGNLALYYDPVLDCFSGYALQQ